MMVFLKLVLLGVVLCLVISGVFEIWELPDEW